MLNIIVTLKDIKTGETIERTLDYSNFSVPGITIGNVVAQERALESWIADRGNDQHNTELALINWKIEPPKNTPQ